MADTSHGTATGGQTRDLTVRVAQYAQLIEKVVLEVGEHPDFEMKRECSISTAGAKIEFVKDIQSIATSRIETEKFLIIGADDQLRQFQSVSNVSDFDQAKLHDILAAYLEPVPIFEVFDREAPDGSAYVFLVIPRQPTRLIFAKASVGTQLRQGDLWTKGTGTSKRLGNHSDFAEIMDELVEARVDERVRARVDHAVELALVRQNVANEIGLRLLPPSFDDNNFKPLMESLCAARDEERFGLAIERLRDDVVESWARFSDYDKQARSDGTADYAQTHKEVLQKLNDHYQAVFRPAMRWLTLAGIFTVKNAGPKSFLAMVSNLIREAFEVSHRLLALHSITVYGFNSRREGERFSHISPAIDAVTASHVIGAYIAKRKRFEYFVGLTRHEVHSASWQGTEAKKYMLPFWPIELHAGFGEPTLLTEWGGRIRYCNHQVRLDPLVGSLFGAEADTIKALCDHEFCLELNSFFSLPTHSGPIGAAVEKEHPNTVFAFTPLFLAFDLENIRELAVSVFENVKQGRLEALRDFFWQQSTVALLVTPEGLKLFGKFLDALTGEQTKRFLRSGRVFPPIFSWPKAVSDELVRIRQASMK
jgi:hypothetical protein